MKIGLQCSFDHEYVSLELLTWFSNKVEYANKHNYSTCIKVYHRNSTLKHGNAFEMIIDHSEQILYDKNIFTFG